MKLISKIEILQYILKRKKISAGSELLISVENVNTIRFRDIIELYLKICGIKKYIWKDVYNREVEGQSILYVVSRIITDFVLWLPFLLYTTTTLHLLKKNKQNKKALQFNNNIDKCLYLRTDHYFNIKCGGSVGHIKGVLDGLKKLNVLTTIFSTDKLSGVEETSFFKKVEPNYLLLRNIPDLSEVLYSFQLLKKIEKTNKNLDGFFIYQRYSLGNFTGVLLKNKFNIPYICEYNGSILWIEKNWGKGGGESKKIIFKRLLDKIEKINLYNADIIVTVSDVLKEELLQRGILSEKILVNPNGVNADVYHPKIDGTSVRNQYNLSEKKVLGFIGTFGKWHGAEILTKAFGEYCKLYPNNNLVLFLIGNGLMMPEVKNIIKNYKIEKQVILPGFVEQSLGPIYLAACDILISPHIENPDGTKFFGSPTKLFEYMAMGKPIIASKLGQLQEILKHEETALLTTPGNEIEIVECIHRLINDEKLSSILAENARKEVVSKHTWDKHVEKILEKMKVSV